MNLSYIHFILKILFLVSNFLAPILVLTEYLNFKAYHLCQPFPLSQIVHCTYILIYIVNMMLGYISHHGILLLYFQWKSIMH
jgi:hypothetical protein